MVQAELGSIICVICAICERFLGLSVTVGQVHRHSDDTDKRSFTELVHTLNSGQVSINISKPGITKGQLINLSDTEDLVTVMYCNEIFDPNKPDTFFEPV